MEIANNWTIVVGAVSLISLMFYWSKQAYLDPIVDNEEHVKEKVKDDVGKKLRQFEEIVKEIGEEQFVDEIYDIIIFKKIVRDSKEIFRGKMVPVGVTICIISTILILIWESVNEYITIALLGIITILVYILIQFFNTMGKYENRLSKYLEGEDPTDILKG